MIANEKTQRDLRAVVLDFHPPKQPSLLRGRYQPWLGTALERCALVEGDPCSTVNGAAAAGEIRVRAVIRSRHVRVAAEHHEIGNAARLDKSASCGAPS